MKNTMSPGKYLLENAFWGVLAMMMYRRSLFRSLPGCTLQQSKIALWVLFAAVMALGIFLTLRRGRSDLSVASHLLIVFEIYTFLAYRRDFPRAFGLVLGASLTASAAAYLAAWCRRPRRVRDDRASALAAGRTALSLTGAALVAPLLVSFCLGNSLIKSTVTPTAGTDGAGYTVADHIETVGNLRENVWSGLTPEEKLDTLQVVANIEGRYLGLPHELNVIVSRCGESTLSCYDDAAHTVIMNVEYFDDMSAHEMLDSLTHECFHGYQHRLCDAYESLDEPYAGLLIFADVPEYVYEFGHYENGDDDPDGYYTQLCERRAREYAHMSVLQYYRRIKEHFGCG